MTIARLIGSVLYVLAIFGLPLFLGAGTVHWWRAWVFLGVVLVASVASMLYIFRDNEGLLRERYKPPVQEGQPLADKVILVAFIASFMGVILLIPLDAMRYHWMRPPGPLASAAGLALFLAAWWLLSVAERENAFAAPVVRHQEERGQTVVDTGIYSVIRHPMYTGGILLVAGMPLWLGSTAALIAAAIPALLLVLRISEEERFLRRELPGYEEYTRRVRYRLVPFVW